MKLEKLLRGIVLTGIFSMPLLVFVVIDSTFFPFIFGKNIFFRVIVEVIFAAWLALALADKSYRPRITPVTVAVTIFTIVVFLADIFGINPTKSLWSNFERMEGFVTIFHLYLFYIVTSSIFVREKIALWFWRASLGSSFFLVLNSAIQFITTDKVRLDSTLGNPIYQAVYALFNIFIALLLMTREGASRWERVAYAATLPLLFWVLYATATRGAILGTIGGLLLASLGILVTLRGNQYVRLGAAVVVIAGLLVVGGFFLAKDSMFVQENPVLQRFAGMSLSEGTVFARTVNWSIAWEGVKERPLLGWGQENYSVVFNQYYDARMHDQEQWFDRVHNVVFDWLIAAGFLGLLSYLAIFLSMLWCIYRAESISLTQKWLLVGLLAAYSFHNLTVFDQIVSYILFFAFAAWVAASATSKRVFLEQLPTVRSVVPFVIGIFIVTTILIYTINVSPWNTNKSFFNGLARFQLAIFAAEQQNKPEQANANLKLSLEEIKASRLGSLYGEQEINEQLAAKATTLFSKDWVDRQVLEAWYRAGVEGLASMYERMPRETRFYVFSASLYEAAGEYQKQKELLEAARKSSPNRQILIAGLAANAQNRGEDEKILPLLAEAYELDPSFEEVAALYAIRLVIEGDIEKFDELFGDSTYVGSDFRLLNALARDGYHDRAFKFWEQALLERREKRLVFLLAAIYEQLGDYENVQRAVARAIEIEPNAREEGEKALEALKQKFGQ
jgi:O-antigen ligase